MALRAGIKSVAFYAILAVFLESCAFFGTGRGPGIEGCHPEECFNHALSARKQGRFKDAAAVLNSIRARFPSTEWSFRASFLLGLDSLEKGAAQVSVEFFNEATGLKAIKDYVLANLARAHLKLERYDDAVSVLDVILKEYPSSPVVPEALFLKADSLEKMGRILNSIEALGELTALYPSSVFTAAAYLKTAEAMLKSGEINPASDALKQILVKHPASKEAEAAEAVFEGLKGAGPDSFALTEAEQFERAKNLFEANRNRKAASVFSTLLTASDGVIREDSTMLLATVEARLKRYSEAERVLRGYLNSPAPSKEKEALGFLSLIALRRTDTDALRAVEKTLSEKFPSSRERAQALFNLGLFHKGRGETETAVEYFNALLNGFSWTEAAKDSLWEIGWMRYRDDRFEEAFSVFSSYPGLSSNSRAPANDKFLYWAAASALKTGRAEEASSLYQRLCSEFNRTYYCEMAVAKGLVSGGGKSGAEAVEGGKVKSPGARDKGQSPVASDLRYLAAKELAFLGLRQEASAEAGILLDKYSSDSSALLELTYLFYEAEDYYRALIACQRYYLAALKEGNAPLELTEITLPMKIVDDVKGFSSDRVLVDPYLVAAVMKEESSFNPETVSTAGAIGLMQIMPATGERIAKNMGFKGGFDVNILFDPATSIRLGSMYLGLLYRRFGNNIILTIAAYNAGPQAVEKWLEASPLEVSSPDVSPKEIDEFIEAIPYLETRNYAKKVFRTYAHYLKSAGINTTGILTRPVASNE